MAGLGQQPLDGERPEIPQKSGPGMAKRTLAKRVPFSGPVEMVGNADFDPFLALVLLR
jgi:hypothetical protein